MVLTGRRLEVLDDVRKSVEKVHRTNNFMDSKVWCVQCDVTDESSVEQAFDSVSHNTDDSRNYIDLVIFNVAPPYPSNFKFEGWGDVLLPHQIDIQDMSMQYDTQVNGLIRICKQVLPGMIERKRGCILLSGES